MKQLALNGLLHTGVKRVDGLTLEEAIERYSPEGTAYTPKPMACGTALRAEDAIFDGLAERCISVARHRIAQRDAYAISTMHM